MKSSIIQHIRKMYVVDSISKQNFFRENDSCEVTTIHILFMLKRLGVIVNNNNGDEEPDFDAYILEIILFRRSHTFLLVKENHKIYIVSSYMNLHRSHIEKLSKNIEDILKDINEIEFNDNVELHDELFHTNDLPCLSLHKRLSQVKIHSYSLSTSTSFFGFCV